MYTYNFLFLCFSLNTVLHAIVNFYQQTHMNWPTDKVRYRSSLSKFNKFWVHTCILTTLIFYFLLTIKLCMEFQQLNVIFLLLATLIFVLYLWAYHYYHYYNNRYVKKEINMYDWPFFGLELGLKTVAVYIFMYVYKFSSSMLCSQSIPSWSFS